MLSDIYPGDWQSLQVRQQARVTWPQNLSDLPNELKKRSFFRYSVDAPTIK